MGWAGRPGAGRRAIRAAALHCRKGHASIPRRFDSHQRAMIGPQISTRVDVSITLAKARFHSHLETRAVAARGGSPVSNKDKTT
jgi:hypothetical protein